MEKNIKYIGKAEGANLHPDYVDAEIYRYEYKGKPITIYMQNGKVTKLSHSAERCNNFCEFESSKEYEEVINYLEQSNNI